MRRAGPAVVSVLLPAVIGGAVLAPLAVEAGSGLVTSLVVLGAAVAATAALRAWPVTSRILVFSGIPLLAALVLETLAVPSNAFVDGLAGLGAVGVLAAVTWDPDRLGRRLALGLLLPATSLALSWMVFVALPAETQFVGVAAVLLLAGVGFLAWVLARPAELAGASPS